MSSRECMFAALAEPRTRKAFTMLETLMVLALGGMLLLAAASFLFGAITLRKEIEDTPQLGQHAASVGRLLESLVIGAEPQQAAAAGAAGNSAGSMSTLIAWQALPASVFGSNEALYLKVRPGLPMFIGEQGFVDATLDCYLLFERDTGLVLLWQSARMKEEDANNWERTVLSSLVTSAQLFYYDAERERWEQTEGFEQLTGNTSALPQVLSLTFTAPDTGRTATAEVLLPVASPQLLGL